ncbi:MAG TPA: multiubiquitin domain-containing protein [Hanamia sp.]
MENPNKGAGFSTADKELQITIEDKLYGWDRQYITGKEVKLLGGLPADSELFLTVSEPWKDEPIENEEEVDLARPGIEGFYVKKKLEFIINGKSFETDRQYILESEIRRLGYISEDFDIFLSIHGPYEDELIKENERVDLARPGVEHFYSKEKPVEFIIIVNTRDKDWKEKTISFEQVVVLAYGSYDPNPNKGYTVTYCRGHEPKPEGTMIKGSVVRVKNKMVFDVSATDKS